MSESKFGGLSLALLFTDTLASQIGVVVTSRLTARCIVS
jgi:hypothetical protein